MVLSWTVQGCVFTGHLVCRCSVPGAEDPSRALSLPPSQGKGLKRNSEYHQKPVMGWSPGSQGRSEGGNSWIAVWADPVGSVLRVADFRLPGLNCQSASCLLSSAGPVTNSTGSPAKEGGRGRAKWAPWVWGQVGASSPALSH